MTAIKIFYSIKYIDHIINIYIYIQYIYIYIYIYIYNICKIFTSWPLKWFSENQIKENTDKCHLLMTKDESSETHIGKSIIKSSDIEKLLNIKINPKLYF